MFYVTYTLINSYVLKYCVVFSEAKKTLILNVDDRAPQGWSRFLMLNHIHHYSIALGVKTKPTAHLLFRYQPWKFVIIKCSLLFHLRITVSPQGSEELIYSLLTTRTMVISFSVVFPLGNFNILVLEENFPICLRNTN